MQCKAKNFQISHIKTSTHCLLHYCSNTDPSRGNVTVADDLCPINYVTRSKTAPGNVAKTRTAHFAVSSSVGIKVALVSLLN